MVSLLGEKKKEYMPECRSQANCIFTISVRNLRAGYLIYEQRLLFPAKSISNYKLMYYQVYCLLKKESQTFLGEEMDLNCHLFADLDHRCPIIYIKLPC